MYRMDVTFKITEEVEQQICIQFCIKFEHSSTGTIWMIQKAFGDDAMSAVWHKCFKDGPESDENVPHSGRPATSRSPEKVECVWLQSTEISS